MLNQVHYLDWSLKRNFSKVLSFQSIYLRKVPTKFGEYSCKTFLVILCTRKMPQTLVHTDRQTDNPSEYYTTTVGCKVTTLYYKWCYRAHYLSVLGIASVKQDRLITTSQNGWSSMKNQFPFPGYRMVYSDTYFHLTFSTRRSALPVRHRQSGQCKKWLECAD